MTKLLQDPVFSGKSDLWVALKAAFEAIPLAPLCRCMITHLPVLGCQGSAVCP